MSGYTKSNRVTRPGPAEYNAAMEVAMKPRRCFAVFILVPVILAAATACRRDEGASRQRAITFTTRDEAVYVVPDEGSPPVLTMNMADVEKPGHPAEFTSLFHLPPVPQGETGTCWAFAATSLLESELRRLGREPVKLSEMHTVYWEYVDKARRFIRERGNSFLGQGSQPDSALQRIKTYGVVRIEDYPGLPAGRTEHDHSELFRDILGLLRDHRAREDWNEDKAVAGVRAVLDRVLGRPPDRITVDGRSLTPREYLSRELGLNPDDYVAFISTLALPVHTRGEFDVPDNWSRAADYHNLPLHEFYLTLLRALRRGYTATLSIDFTEPGYVPAEDAAVIPSFDIPAGHIDAAAREIRFAAGSTTDDHAVHGTGYKDHGGKGSWFLIKDSWKTAFEGRHAGYMFLRDDYIRMKTLMFMTHKSAVSDILAKFPKED